MLHFLIRHVLAPLARAVYRPHVEGASNVPAVGPVLFASNHRSAADTALIAFLVPRPVAFLAKAEYFTGTTPRKRAMASFLSALGYVPVERGSARGGLAALDTAQKVLESGGAYSIYPEGTRSLDGRLHKGHTGVAQLALSTGATVVPVGMCNTDNLLPIGKKIPRLVPITVRFGKPLEFSRYDGMAESPAVRRSVTDEIMYAISELTDQEYVDQYHKRPED